MKMLNKKGSIEFTTREVIILIIVIIIAAIVIGITISRLDLIQKTLTLISGQGEVLASAA